MIARNLVVAPSRSTVSWRRPAGIAVDAAIFGVLAIGVLILTYPLLSSSDYPNGADALGHLFKVWYLTKQFLLTGRLAEWMPQWYMGHSVLQYYPPLSVLLMIPIDLLTGDIVLTNKIFVFLCFWMAAIFACLIARNWLGRGAGLCAGLVYIYAPYNIIGAFSHGSHPKILSTAIAPIAFYFSLRLLQKPSRLLFVAAALVASAMVLTHHMEMLIIYITLAGFAACYTFFRNLPLRNLAILALAVLAGVGLTAFWLLPALTNFDLPNVPYMMVAQVWQQSHTTELIDPGLRRDGIGLTYMGASLFALGIAGAFLRRDALSWSLFGGLVVGLFFVTGVKNPLYLGVPYLSTRLLPERFLIPISLLLALLVAGLVFFPYQKLLRASMPNAVIGIVILATIYTDVSPYFNVVRTAVHPSWSAAMRQLSTLPGDGRFDYLLRNWGSEASYLPSVLGTKPQVRGWSVEGTPHWAMLENMGRAVENGFYDYAFRNLGLWNVRFTMIDFDSPLLQRALEDEGFHKVWNDEFFTLLKNDEPSSYVMRQDRSIIAIGKGTEIAATVYPWMAQGTSLYVDDYSVDYLSHFDGVLLYGYLQRREGAADALIRELVRRGKAVFVDMRGANQTTLLGVSQWTIDVPDDLTLLINDESIISPDTSLALRSFRYKGEPWRPNSYVNLDGIAVGGIVDGQEWPLIGYKNVDAGRVFFIGYDTFNHIMVTKDDQARELLDHLFDVVHPNRALWPAPLAVTDDNWEGQSPHFRYSSPEATDAIVSMTFSPHWKVQIDGRATPVLSHENLMLLSLPAGEHEVTLAYAGTPIQGAGQALSLIALVGIALALVVQWRRIMLFGQERAQALVLRMIVYLNSAETTQDER